MESPTQKTHRHTKELEELLKKKANFLAVKQELEARQASITEQLRMAEAEVWYLNGRIQLEEEQLRGSPPAASPAGIVTQ